MQATAELLLRWYDRHKRILPWRDIHDPYRTWVSEAMLQQTRVETVLGYYERFLNAFPDIFALAAAPEEAVLKQWEGLGYYSRARNLHQGAQQVVRDYGGVIPRDPEVLKKIKGIGPYSAGAIASIAYNVPAVAMDGNVIRVISRIRGIREDASQPAVQEGIRRAVAELQPPDRPGDFNQALMDLGATVCVPGTPDCEGCPLRRCCDAFQKEDAAELPVMPKKAPPKTVMLDVPLILSGGRVLMRQRTEALLKGLWVFPLLEHSEAEVPEQSGSALPDRGLSEALSARVKKKLKLSLSGWADCGEARHVFTHLIWQMHLYLVQSPDTLTAPEGYVFVPLEDIKKLSVPSAMKKAMVLLEQTAVQ